MINFIYAPPSVFAVSLRDERHFLPIVLITLEDLKPVDPPNFTTRKIEKTGPKRKRNPNRWR